MIQVKKTSHVFDDRFGVHIQVRYDTGTRTYIVETVEGRHLATIDPEDGYSVLFTKDGRYITSSPRAFIISEVGKWCRENEVKYQNTQVTEGTNLYVRYVDTSMFEKPFYVIEAIIPDERNDSEITMAVATYNAEDDELLMNRKIPPSQLTTISKLVKDAKRDWKRKRCPVPDHYVAMPFESRKSVINHSCATTDSLTRLYVEASDVENGVTKLPVFTTWNKSVDAVGCFVFNPDSSRWSWSPRLVATYSLSTMEAITIIHKDLQDYVDKNFK